MAAGYTYVQITSRNLSRWKDVIIPVIYDELETSRKEMQENYFCIGVKDKAGIVGAIVAHIEHDTSDIQIISIYVLPDKRRKGAGSGLIKKLYDMASEGYCFEKREYSADVFIKTMYSLPEEIKVVYETFLKKNSFTQFYIFKNSEDGIPALCGADALLRIYNMSDED